MNWTFLTNHTHVLICIQRDPYARVRDIAEQVKITERSVQRIIGELTEYGVVTREKEGRRNRYKLCLDLPLRHPLESGRCVSDLLDLVAKVETLSK